MPFVFHRGQSPKSTVAIMHSMFTYSQLCRQSSAHTKASHLLCSQKLVDTSQRERIKCFLRMCMWEHDIGVQYQVFPIYSMCTVAFTRNIDKDSQNMLWHACKHWRHCILITGDVLLEKKYPTSLRNFNAHTISRN